MSATASQAQATTLTAKQEDILDFLHEHAATKTYFKSRLIGDELGLSAKEVGTNMPAIQRADTGLDVEKWGYSSSTTWKVTT